MEQGQHGKDASLPAIIGPHDEQGVFYADHQVQRPKYHGKHAQDIFR